MRRKDTFSFSLVKSAIFPQSRLHGRQRRKPSFLLTLHSLNVQTNQGPQPREAHAFCAQVSHRKISQPGFSLAPASLADLSIKDPIYRDRSRQISKEDEVVTLMKKFPLPLILTSAICLSAGTPGLFAQNSTQLFGPVDIRLSQTGASYTAPNGFNTKTLNLTCAAAPISAVLSGPLMNAAGSAPLLDQNGALQPGGNLLVDNNVLVSVQPVGGAVGAQTNVCTGGTVMGTSPLYAQNCYVASGYNNSGGAVALLGQDTDTFVPYGGTQTIDASGGVAPIQIGSKLGAGAQSVSIALDDEGIEFSNSTLFLTTNCAIGGVSGPAQITGNTIGSTPTPPQQTQSFSFNGQTDQLVGFVYDLSGAVGTLISNSGQSTPQVADVPLNPATFQSNFGANTSFATSKCLVHSGELGGPVGQAATLPACKLYTLECTTGTGNSATGAQCPVSSVANEVVKDIFDGPNFTLPDLHATNGKTFHTGLGLLMASEGWGAETGNAPGVWNWNGGTGGPCAFDPAANLNLPCPQNLLTSFTGPGTFGGTGATTHPNSTFISIAQVPEPLTTPTITGLRRGNWVHNRTITVNLDATPPYLQGTAVANAASFVPSPIQNVSYGITPANAVPAPADLPIAADTTLLNSECPIPTAANPGPFSQPDFVPAVQSVTVPTDGAYVLHYYAQDCAGTRELKFQQVSQSWTTNFYTQAINVDTVAPRIVGLTLSPGGPAVPTYTQGQSVTASFSCTDGGSGVDWCQNYYYSPALASTPVLTAPVDTAKLGSHTFTMLSIDYAGNISSLSAPYKVIAAPQP